MSDPGLEARLAQLTPEARAALSRRLARQRGGHSAIPRRDRGQPAPMSFAQTRLWFLEQLRPGTNAWNTPVATLLRGPLNVEALRRSFELVVARHATLRTTFAAPGGKPSPVERPASEIEFELPVQTASGDRAALTESFVDATVAETFSLESDLMLRARLLELSSEEHVLVLVAHHIACDGWSKGLLLSELSAAYDALSVGRDPNLPELPIDYGDFAAWQRATLTGRTLERLVDYWRLRLAGAPPTIGLRTDHPRPSRQRLHGAVQWLSVPVETTRAMFGLARQERTTPFIALMAAFDVLLHAHTGEDDVLVGSPAAMRVRPELEPLIGLFANTLVYRASLGEHPSFRQVIGRVRETAVGAYANQDLPFEKVVEAVRPPRDPTRNPLVQVNVRLEEPEPQLELESLHTEPIRIDPGFSRFDLAIELSPAEGGLEGYLEYDTDLFDAATAATMAADFVAVLDAVVVSPDEPVDRIQVMREIAARRRAGVRP